MESNLAHSPDVLEDRTLLSMLHTLVEPPRPLLGGAEVSVSRKRSGAGRILSQTFSQIIPICRQDPIPRSL
jgi:hypothetical protein